MDQKTGKEFFLLQKKAIRIITNDISCKKLFKNLKILTFPCAYILKVLLFVKNNEDIFQKNSDSHECNTRYKQNFSIPKHNTVAYGKGLHNQGIIMYNKLPNEVKNMPLKSFKKCITNLLVNKCFSSVQEYMSYTF